MKPDSLLTHLGRDPEKNFGVVNPPIYRASTILFPDLASFNKRRERKYTGFSYGINGTPTTFALTEAHAELEGGFRSLAFSSGLSAITLPLLAFLKQGDHILVADTVYGPTRGFCDSVLTRLGVEVTYYDPGLGDGIGALFRPTTRVVFCESPGSLTFDIQDIPAIADVAHRKGAVVFLDNTWATPLYFRPFDHGVDVSLYAGTKYLGGHSDLMIGIATAGSEEHFKTIKDSVAAFGDCVSPDICYEALRGMRTMGVRLRHQEQSALTVANWLATRPEVKRVLHPALPDHPGHGLWKRDFKGSSGLFAILLRTGDEAAIAAMIDHLTFFGIGASWGGFESLIIPADPGPMRTAVPWQEEGYLLRLNIGLEDVSDLIEDLSVGLDRLNAALQ